MVVLATAGVCLSLIAYAFTLQDRQYSIPAPRPDGWEQPPLGTRVDLASLGHSSPSQPLFLNFLNPDCPCSRFNVAHLQGLLHRYGKQARFVAVLQGDRTPAELTAAFSRLHLQMESVVDSSGELARITGVYSSPQAVLLDASSRLYFRGNYNSSRYCTAPESEFARMALDSLLAHRPYRLVPAADSAYGCPLPKSRLRAQSPLRLPTQ